MTDEAFEKYQSVWTAVHNLVDKMLSGEAGAEDIRDKLTDEFRFWKRSGHDISATTPQPEQESFSNEAISATQAAWKMGYDAAKAEQPEQEPVARLTCEELGYVPLSADGKSVYIDGVGLVRLEQPKQEPTAERAWFTIAELNAWADKKLSENPHWVMPKDKPERDEPPPEQDVPEASCGNMVPVGWLESPDGAFRANPLYKIKFPSKLLSWQVSLYTAAPQRKPLTDKAITQVIDSMPKKMKGFMVDWDLYEFARAIRARGQK